jgi:hypothetical protein
MEASVRAENAMIAQETSKTKFKNQVCDFFSLTTLVAILQHGML